MSVVFRADNPTLKRPDQPALCLDGEWEFLVDPRPDADHPTEQFYSPEREFPGLIRVPSCWQAQVGEQAATSFLYNYRNVAFYRRRFVIPAAWSSQRVWLRLGGVAPAADVWVNGTHLGHTNSSRTPLKCDVSALIQPGAENDLVIRVSRPHLRLDGTWDYANGGWEGIYRSVGVAAAPAAWIEDAFVLPDVGRSQILVRALLETAAASSGSCQLQAQVISAKGEVCASSEVPVLLSDGAPQPVELVLPLQPILWWPDEPYLYRACLSLSREGEPLDHVHVRFGVRDVRVEGNRLLLNGVPLFLRGFGWNIGYYPETVSPPTDKDFYLRRIQMAKEYGFNYTKTEIEALVPEALEAADEAGLLVTLEMPFGMNSAHRLYRNDPPDEFRELWERELQNIVRCTRNYSSVFNYSMASELGLEGQTPASFELFNQRLPRLTRELAPHTLVTDTTSGAGIKLETRFGTRETDICEHHYWRDVLDAPLLGRRYTFGQRASHPAYDAAEGLSLADSDRPYVFHEYLWWSAYPNVALKPKYIGHPMIPYWLTEAERIAQRQGLEPLLERFARNSEKVLGICRKEGIEFARRQVEASGYLLYMLLDMTWSVEGLLDDFGDPKPVTSAAELRCSNAPTVILLNDHERRCYWYGEPLELDLWVSHYGARAIERGTLRWQLTAGSATVLQDECAVACACGSVGSVYCRSLSLPQRELASQLTLDVQLVGDDGAVVNRNHWYLWGFPPVAQPDWPVGRVLVDEPLAGWEQRFPALARLPAGQPIANDVQLVVVTGQVTEPVVDYLARGGRAVVFSAGGLPEVRLRYNDLYRTTPWNTGTTGNSGTLIERHPALEHFPYDDDYCDLQFVHLIKGAFPLDLDAYCPARIVPILRAIDHYRKGRHKAYLFEASVGGGKLLATSLNIRQTYDDTHPETVFLVNELLRYALSGAFQPQSGIAPDALRQWLGAAPP